MAVAFPIRQRDDNAEYDESCCLSMLCFRVRGFEDRRKTGWMHAIEHLHQIRKKKLGFIDRGTCLLDRVRVDMVHPAGRHP